MKKGLSFYSLIVVLVFGLLMAGCGSAASVEGDDTYSESFDPSVSSNDDNNDATSDDEGAIIASVPEDLGQELVASVSDNENDDAIATVSGDEVASNDGDEADTSSQMANQSEDDTDTSDSDDEQDEQIVAEATQVIENEVVAAGSQGSQVTSIPARSSSPRVLVPAASGTSVIGNQYISIDISNLSQGYFIANYLGSCGRVKLQVTASNGSTYNYNITNAQAVIPLSTGSGSYTVKCCENISDNQYAVVYQETFSANITNTFGAFLYPNYYVNFNASSAVVASAQSVVSSSTSDLEAVEAVYNYVVNNISYDSALAASAQKGYVPNPDATLASRNGICFDYAALMAAMLRSQGIPTRVEVGYAKDAYHAWVSVYITDVGWINGIIEFKGNSWTLMDPTYAANNSEAALRSFIGNGSNYVTKYMY